MKTRCPKCRWFLRFAPYSVIYKFNKLNIWQGYCWNPNCDYGHKSDGGFRVVNPSEAVS